MRSLPLSAGSGPSRTSTRGAGWGCRTPGVGAGLAPRDSRLSWLRPGPLIKSRNDVLARRLGDPPDGQRREWLRRLDEYARVAGAPLPPRDRLITRYADRERVSVALLGDPGEGDASQYVVVPVLDRVARDTDFAVLCSDVVYPAGGVRGYADRFYRPYADYPGPIYALPGNHDWYDGLAGFMTTFCDAPPDAGAPRPMFTGSWWRLVLIDTGIDGHIDRDQAEWLREISAGDRPKILLTGRPIYTYARRQDSPIEGGDDHNYQRYPVLQRDGRTIQYLVAGGSGAYLSATHQIPNVDRLAPAVHEEGFR